MTAIAAGGPPAPFVFVIAGEPSGDALGAALIRGLRQRTDNRLRVAGIGGEQMREEGVDSLVPLGDLAVIGPQTIVLAAESGLRGIAAEAGATLVLDRSEVIRLADAAGLFVVGIRPA